MEEVMGEGQAKPIKPMINRNDNLGQQLLHKAKKSCKGGYLPGFYREVYSNGLIGTSREDKDLSRIKGFNVCNPDFEWNVEVCCKTTEIFFDEMKLERVEGRGGHKSGDFEQQDPRRLPLSQLLHERGPLRAEANVKVDYVNAVSGTELLNESLSGSEAYKLRDWRNLGEGLVGTQLKNHI
ncbi:hypothetical protein IEQ34_014506 [Dendrobium chrysotoxum]|uniref:Uncharacterized protein n=1 Tax=Dendrobium chrysotoxum TaxID=161865 RepID=A0AAV7G418_DENCH|nr:hypothetical protein IEQ34_014506 [Dendrobium chrysotoxum]